MKEKIENLIKEVGINEVETILKEMKSKVSVKEELKKDFVELLTGCTISFDCDVINYKKGDEWFFQHQKTYNCFYFRYEFWSNFESKYDLNYQELSDLLVGILEEVLNCKGLNTGRGINF